MKIRLHRLLSVGYLALSPFYHVRATPARRDRRQNRPGRTERTSLTLDLSRESQRDPSLTSDFFKRRKLILLVPFAAGRDDDPGRIVVFHRAPETFYLRAPYPYETIRK